MRIIQVVPDFSLGGVQKAGCLIGKHIASKGHDSWVIGHKEGPRFEAENDLTGVRHLVIDRSELASRLTELKPDLIHIHASSYEKADPASLLANEQLAGCVIVVTPVFGRPPQDRGLLNRVKTCCVGVYTYYRLLKWLSWSSEEACRRGIVYAPLTPFEPPASAVLATDPPDVVQSRRAQLGVPQDAFLLGRLGRNSPSKWHPRVSAIVDRFLNECPSGAWVSVGMPAERGADELKQKWGDRFINFSETSDYELLCRIMASLDAQFFYSSFGECFASSICDPASLGVPTLAVSNLFNDNGQAEQVINGRTGFLLGRPEDAIEPIQRLIANPTELAALKESTRDYASSNWRLDVVGARLEQAYQQWIDHASDSGTLCQTLTAEHQEFAKSYRRRVVGLTSNNPVTYGVRYLALAALECYPIMRLGRRVTRFIRRR